jgi:hypothetical protein
VLVGLLVVLTMPAPAAAAPTAASFSWYASGLPDSNLSCWQQGSRSPAPSGVATPATAATTCPSIALSSHTVGGTGAVGGGIGGDLPLSPGDYCNYYRTGHTFQPDSTDQSGLTGFDPALTPRSAYQMGDALGNVCQSTGAEWGQGVIASNVAANNETCYAFCGVHHYASFNTYPPPPQTQPRTSPPINNRPWDAWFADPSLVVSSSVNVNAFTAQGYASGWGYVCPELRDSTSGWTVEYCVEEWRQNYNNALGPPACGTGAGYNDQVITPLPSGTGKKNWASVSAGPGTFDLGQLPSGFTQIAASITASQLKTALSQIQTTCAPSPLSSDPRDYQLIGVEQGHEFAGLNFRSGGATQNLQLVTTYTVSNAPTNSAPPYITGTIAVNTPARANPGSWSGRRLTYAYQWNRCDGNGANCTPISGATGSSYTPSAGEVGATLTVTVAAGSSVSGTTNLAWSAPVTSAPSAPIAPAQGTAQAAVAALRQPTTIRAQPLGPTVGQLKTSLARQLGPGPDGATISAIRSAGAYQQEFTARLPGTVAISWYQAGESTVVATGRRTFGRDGKGTLAIRLTKDGRTLLEQARSQDLVAEGVFTPRGGNPVLAAKRFSLRR